MSMASAVTDENFEGEIEKHTGLVGAHGRRMRELVPRHEAHWFQAYGLVAATGEPVSSRYALLVWSHSQCCTR